jgi:hypothetical protein
MTSQTYTVDHDGRFLIDAPCFLFSSDEAYSVATGHDYAAATGWHNTPRLVLSRASFERRARSDRPVDAWAAFRSEVRRVAAWTTIGAQFRAVLAECVR